MKFQASTLDQYHHLFTNLSGISASKHLSARYCTARSHRGHHYDCTLVILYSHASMCSNTACSTEAEQRLCSEALTSEVDLLQNLRAHKKWILLSIENKSFRSKESDTKILHSMYFAYEVDIISSYSNRIP